jgi:hypothetical protein
VSRAAVFTAAAYGAWVALCVLSTLLAVVDAGVNAHLALVLTAPPASLLSLILPNGSQPAVLATGVLGLAQWFAVAELLSLWFVRRRANSTPKAASIDDHRAGAAWWPSLLRLTTPTPALH